MTTFASQKITTPWRNIGDNRKMRVTMRHDDECRNGHNTFAITADIYKGGCFDSGGCLHDEIREHFPELAHLIQWHLCSTDGPLHYIANTAYHAGDLDCWNKPGKDRDFDAARHCAIWPEATDDELSLPAPELAAKLRDRLPELLERFRAAVESAGFRYLNTQEETP